VENRNIPGAAESSVERKPRVPSLCYSVEHRNIPGAAESSVERKPSVPSLYCIVTSTTFSEQNILKYIWLKKLFL
jgi:hypothetical protein